VLRRLVDATDEGVKNSSFVRDYRSLAESRVFSSSARTVCARRTGARLSRPRDRGFFDEWTRLIKGCILKKSRENEDLSRRNGHDVAPKSARESITTFHARLLRVNFRQFRSLRACYDEKSVLQNGAFADREETQPTGG
jgi:hypothetical protein